MTDGTSLKPTDVVSFLICIVSYRQAQYNDIMTRSDKDFITRIQVSQLVTQDPYADDFYAQVYGAILRSKMGAPNGPVSVLQLGRDGTGVGVGVPGGRGAGRRDFAMQRMTMQVKRIVDAAKQRERTKGDSEWDALRYAAPLSRVLTT